ncbi:MULTISPECIES: hypothetical protein [unclassified Moraxella]|uniref:hypothetical protein n=1 Tax=unclassified Moraxella TaxID=2685852 RepID=UPI002B4077CE|nr:MULTISPECIES: hypothetical protein [unclassified Moraxella]
MTYYINSKGDIAKVLGVDDRTGMASVVINDKHTIKPWDKFIEEFSIGVKNERPNQPPIQLLGRLPDDKTN